MLDCNYSCNSPNGILEEMLLVEVEFGLAVLGEVILIVDRLCMCDLLDEDGPAPARCS